MLFTEVITSPLLLFHNPLKSTQMCSGVIETSSVLPRKSSFMFGNPRFFRKSLAIFGNVRKCQETIFRTSENFCRIFGNLKKVFGNLWKTVQKQFVYVTKRIINSSLLYGISLLVFNLISSSSSSSYLTRSLRLIVRQQV